MALTYQLNLRKMHLISLLATWTRSLRSVLPFVSDDELPSWGPDKEEIMGARVAELTQSTLQTAIGRNRDQSAYNDDSDDEGSSFLESESDYIDSTLLDTLEAVDMADAFRYNAD